MGVLLLGSPCPTSSGPTGRFHAFSLTPPRLALRAMNCACRRGTIRSQIRPGEGTAGMSRVSSPLRMKKISDGRRAVLYCWGNHNEIPQERLK